MRLIDADELCKDGYNLALTKWDYRPDGRPYAWTELTPISEVPTIDAVPVVHSNWVPTSEFDEVYGYVFKCKSCGGETIGTTLFCQKCGAKMDGKSGEEDADA